MMLHSGDQSAHINFERKLETVFGKNLFPEGHRRELLTSNPKSHKPTTQALPEKANQSLANEK